MIYNTLHTLRNANPYKNSHVKNNISRSKIKNETREKFVPL